MNMQRGRLVSGGRLQVPAGIRRALGLADGDVVMLRVADGELIVRPVRESIARVQARLTRHLGEGAHLSDELIADRRAASARE